MESNIKLRQWLFILGHGVVLGFLSIVIGQTTGLLRILGSGIIFYFLWSTSYMLRYFQLKNMGFQRMNALQKEKLLIHMENGDVKRGHFMYHSGIYPQGVVLTFETSNETLFVTYAPMFQTSRMTKKNMDQIKESIEKALMKNKRYRLKMILKEIDIVIGRT